MDDVKKNMESYTVLDHSPIGQFILKKDFTVLFWNRCIELWSGISRDEIVGTNIANNFPHLEDAKYANRIKNIFEGGPPIVFSSQLHKHFMALPLPGDKFRVQNTIVTGIPTGEDGEFYAFFAIQDETNLTAALESNKLTLKQLTREIEIRKQTEKKLIQIAQFDPLTNLANRTLFREFLVKALANSQRRKQSIAVLFLDLDDFKDVNDSLGHEAGDLLLKGVAERLIRQVRANDLVARLGGDEFAIILDDCQPDDAAHVAKNILVTLKPHHTLASQEVFISSSIGIAMHPGAGRDPEKLCKAADTAMYHAKEQGKNNFQFFSSEMHEQTMKRLQIENDIRRALKQKEFILYYQPQVDTRCNKIIGVEALIRWQHSTLGLVPPSQFIPVAEKTDIISPLSVCVMRMACEKAREWENDKNLLTPVTVAVNVSIRQLRDDVFWRTTQKILAETGLDPQYLEIELTESSIMDDPEATIALLKRIHQQGVRVSVDDFGTGYSSLNYLQRLPIDTVKIDLSFVRGIGKDRNSEVIIKTIIALAQNLGLRTIAEGVEDKEQLDFLQAHDCNLMQGYYFSRPLREEDATQFLKDGVPQR